MKTCLLTILCVAVELSASAQTNETDFVSIFDGKSLAGWHVSAKTGHSRASKNESGGKWLIEDGAIVGSQDIPANGGLVITDKKYSDFEVKLEMKKVSWPTRTEVVNTTIIVIIAVFFFAFYLFGTDLVFSYLIEGLEWLARKVF